MTFQENNYTVYAIEDFLRQHLMNFSCLSIIKKKPLYNFKKIIIKATSKMSCVKISKKIFLVFQKFIINYLILFKSKYLPNYYVEKLCVIKFVDLGLVYYNGFLRIFSQHNGNRNKINIIIMFDLLSIYHNFFQGMIEDVLGAKKLLNLWFFRRLPFFPNIFLKLSIIMKIDMFGKFPHFMNESNN